MVARNRDSTTRPTAAATSREAQRRAALKKARRALAEKRSRTLAEEQRAAAQQLKVLRSRLTAAEHEYDEAYALAVCFGDRPRFEEREERAWDRADRAQAAVLGLSASIRRLEEKASADDRARG